MAKGATIDGEVFISIGKRNNIYIYIYVMSWLQRRKYFLHIHQLDRKSPEI